MKLLMTHRSPLSYYFICLRSKYFPREFVLKPVVNRCSFSVSDFPYKVSDITIVVCILIFIVFDRRWEDKQLRTKST
jgi:hypothetical protein